MKAHLALLLAGSLVATVDAQTTYRVDASAAPGGNGHSWAQAFATLDHALDAAQNGDEIWVAAGSYKPRRRTIPNDPRSVSFTPRNGVRMYGGFAGDEATLDARAGLFAETILEGEIGHPSTISDNARHVVRLDGNGFFHTFDGFCVQNANADGIQQNGTGAGIFVQLGTKEIRNCIFRRNRAVRGGALYVEASNCRIQNCLFEENLASRGGGVFSTMQLQMANCVFRRNAAFNRGGAIFLTQGVTYPSGLPRSVFQNCLFYGNRARTGGAVSFSAGGVTNTPGKAVFTGCTLVANFAAIRGGGIASPPDFLQHCDCQVWNSILWNNEAPEGPQYSGNADHMELLYSDFQGGWPGVGNINSNPRFKNALGHDYELRSLSPCIDSGSNPHITVDFWDLDNDSVFNETVPIDLLGNPRRDDDPTMPDTGAGNAPITDMGAHERIGGSDG